MQIKKIVILFLVSIILKAAQAQREKIFFISKENTRVFLNKLYNYQFSAGDSSGNTITYSVEKLPSWLSYHAATKTISGKAQKVGQYPVRIIAYTRSDTARQFFMITVCNKQTTDILCLGNSITNGVDSFNSYRRDLWRLLHAANYNFDFIGSRNKHSMGSEVPVPDFDTDHEGHSGWTANDIFYAASWDTAAGNINTWLNLYTPGMVLLELGTNDVFQCRKPAEILKDIYDVLGLLRKKNDHVRFFIAQIPPLGGQWSDKKLCGNDTSYALAILDLNKAIVSFAAAHSTRQSPVMVVDQYTGVDPATDMFDDIHPNKRGEKIMAERWFSAIAPYLKKL